MFLRLACLAAVAGALVAGCQDPLTCQVVDHTCAPLYIPTFDNAYDNTFKPKCAKGGCHVPPTPKGGMDLSDRDGAYAALLDAARDRVIPGNPECSQIIERTTTTDSHYHMPPGAMLLDSERCSLALWIDQGAPRTPPDAGP
jgi:entry exclusion lipoprotein TrbK